MWLSLKCFRASGMSLSSSLQTSTAVDIVILFDLKLLFIIHQFTVPFRHFEYLIRESKQKTFVTEEPGSSENQFQWILYINTYLLLKLLLEMEE